jgi:hypothetical protein
MPARHAGLADASQATEMPSLLLRRRCLLWCTMPSAGVGKVANEAMAVRLEQHLQRPEMLGSLKYMAGAVCPCQRWHRQPAAPCR